MLMLPDYRVRQRDFLLEISRAITAQLDLGEVLKRVLNASVAMLTAQVGIIALRDATGEYQVRATSGIAPEKIADISAQLIDIMHATEAGLDHEVLDSRLKAMIEILDTRLRQYVALPFVFAGEPLGFLIVFRAFQGGATSDDIQVLQSFADQAAIAVHNAQLYERIDQERKRLAAIVQYGADGVMILDPKLQIIMFNRALERMTGWHSKDAIGHYQDEVLVWHRLDMPDLKDAIADGWLQRSSHETLYVEGDLQRADGLTVSIGITYAPLMNSNGELNNIIANVRDITNFRHAQEMQNVFISTISHELKTPVAIIKGYAGTLSRSDADWNPDVINNGLEVIEDEADRLTALIENLLTASRLQAQREMHLTKSEIDLHEIVARSVERFNTQAPNHKITLQFPPDFPIISGDETRLRQVIDNLINNAIKYSPNGGEIMVGGYTSDDNVTVYVRDSGVGISESDLERIFDRFYRVDDTLSRKTQGTGLGLYLAKAIIEAHGGTLHVDSQLGQGSTFFITLPL